MFMTDCRAGQCITAAAVILLLFSVVKIVRVKNRKSFKWLELIFFSVNIVIQMACSTLQRA